MNIDPSIIAFAKAVIGAELKKLCDRGIIRLSESEDIGSSLLAAVVAAWPNFDSDRAPAEAFINQIVNTRLVSILRKRSARKRRAKTEPIDATDDRLVDHSWSGDGWRRQIELRVDMEVAFSKLTPKQREICDQLMREAITPAARQMGVPRTTLRDAVAKIREIFRDAGLEEYF